MRINRALLYAGTFLAAIGVVLVVVDQGVLTTSAVSETLRYWPLALLAIGAGLVLRHTHVSLAGGLLAAAVPGLLLGGTFAVAPRISGDCGVASNPGAALTRSGDLTDGADVSVTMNCGTLTVGTADGTGWRLEATNASGHDPLLSAIGGSLVVESASGSGIDALRSGHNELDLTLPRAHLAQLALDLNLAHGRLNLFGTTIGRLAITTNAGDVQLDASGTGLSEITARVNLGLLSVELPSNSDLSGTFEVNAGGIKLCAPEDLGMRVSTHDVATQVTVQGLKQAGATWESANYTSAEHRADVEITGSFGAVDINPIGGCK